MPRLENFYAVYCTEEDIVCVVPDEDLDYAIEVDECPNCNEPGVVKVLVSEA
jgi:hypothetical protein